MLSKYHRQRFDDRYVRLTERILHNTTKYDGYDSESELEQKIRELGATSLIRFSIAEGLRFSLMEQPE